MSLGFGAGRFGRITVGGRRQSCLRPDRELRDDFGSKSMSGIFRRTSGRLPRDAYGLRDDGSRQVAAAFGHARPSRAVAGADRRSRQRRGSLAELHLRRGRDDAACKRGREGQACDPPSGRGDRHPIARGEGLAGIPQREMQPQQRHKMLPRTLPRGLRGRAHSGKPRVDATEIRK
jgi:hypothetical protein